MSRTHDNWRLQGGNTAAILTHIASPDSNLRRLTPPARIPALDAVKGLSIIGVLFVHMAFTSRFDRDTLASIHALQRFFGWCVLAFFFVSGFLHPASTSAAGWTNFAKKRARRLLVPCLAFSWMYKLALQAMASSGIVISAPLKWPMTPLTLFREAITPAYPQFYFLAYLFLITVSVHALVRCRWFHNDLVPCLFAAVLLQAYSRIPLAEAHGEALTLLPLYAASYLAGIGVARWKGTARQSDIIAAVAIAAFAFAAAIVSAANSQVFFVLIPPITAAIAMLPKQRILSPLAFLGRHSGAVYVWHTPLVMPVLSVLLAKLPITGWPLILAMALATLGVSLALDAVVRRFDPHAIFRL